VTAVADTPLKAGDVLFKIDPVPFQAHGDFLRAGSLKRSGRPSTTQQYSNSAFPVVSR
jgi:multidrug resistance efflux pump